MKKVLSLLVSATLLAALFTGNLLMAEASAPGFPIEENFEDHTGTPGTADTSRGTAPAGWTVTADSSIQQTRYATVFDVASANSGLVEETVGDNLLRIRVGNVIGWVKAAKSFAPP